MTHPAFPVLSETGGLVSRPLRNGGVGHCPLGVRARGQIQAVAFRVLKCILPV